MISKWVFASVLVLALFGATVSLKCGECFAEGRDCKVKSWNDDCDFCARLTGQVVNPSEVSPYAMAVIRDNLGDVSGM